MTTALAVTLGLAVGGPAAADPIGGPWRTEADDGADAVFRIAPCGPAYRGTITRAFDAGGAYRSHNIGRQMAPQGGGRHAGQVWRPSDDRIYRGRIALSGARMEPRGCVAGGLLCASQAWTEPR
jgi:uncharacterized protein (DUF2147 family)